MMTIKLVIFDLDGTLIDAYKPVERSINYTMKQFGFPPVSAETIKRTVGWGDRHLLQNFIGEKDLDTVLAVYRKHHQTSLKKGSKTIPGAKRVLNYLKQRGYKIAVASNRPTAFSDIVIRHLELKEYFDYVLCGDRVHRPKPYPDILKTIMLKFDICPAECLYVGDMTIDIQTGQRAGVKTVAVITGSSTKEELQELKPYALIKDIRELIEILEDIHGTG
ncbi:MAG TPA: HAD family hydrolase [Candidatus Omnitrophota bacterium]|nr:HAD family hydrolase [Candidatus Omnitrophota bacterium]